MPKTRVSCPKCRQPLVAEIDSLFDLNVDPTAKQRLLSGTANLIQCPSCGYQGSYPTPIVYHDPDKELLLTYVPAEMGLPMNEQERVLGNYINQAVNKLPQEKRKAYLLRPQAVLTLQGLMERILEADGITREMIQAQQKRLNLLQRILEANPDSWAEIASQEDASIDSEFFSLLQQLIETALSSGDQESARQLTEIQKLLLEHTTFGRQLKKQAEEIESAMKELQAAGRDLTREKLLQMVIDAPNETRLQAYVSLARPGMDYQFFQLLSERVDRARGDGRSRLVDLREKLLQMTQEVDQRLEARLQAIRKLLEAVLQSKDPAETMAQYLPAVDEYFLRELNQAMDAARQKGDLDRLGRLQKVMDVIQQASAPPPEVALIEELIDAPDDEVRRQILEANSAAITPEFMSALSSITSQVESSNDAELIARVKAVHRQALRFSMQKNLK